MKSLPPKHYELLPSLAAPAGYICVIRDIDRDRYRLEATRWPQALIAAVLAEDERSFGIELVSVLQTDDLSAGEARLYASHHARLSSEWLELDAFQLAELRRSALQIDAFASQYLTREGESLSNVTAPETPDSRAASPAGFGSSGARWKRLRRRAPIANIAYGVGALRRSREAAEARRRQERLYRISPEDEIKEAIGEFLLNHIIKISAIVFALFILLLVYVVFYNQL